MMFLLASDGLTISVCLLLELHSVRKARTDDPRIEVYDVRHHSLTINRALTGRIPTRSSLDSIDVSPDGNHVAIVLHTENLQSQALDVNTKTLLVNVTSGRLLGTRVPRIFKSVDFRMMVRRYCYY